MIWRAEFHECGWASRWYVVSGYFDKTKFLRIQTNDWRNNLIMSFGSKTEAEIAILKISST